MLTLIDIVNRDGVVVAGEFKSGDELHFQSKTVLTREVVAITERLARSFTSVFDKQASAYSKLSKMEFQPQHGWVYCGGDWVLVVGGHRYLIAEWPRDDLRELMRELADTA